MYVAGCATRDGLAPSKDCVDRDTAETKMKEIHSTIRSQCLNQLVSILFSLLNRSIRREQVNGLHWLQMNSSLKQQQDCHRMFKYSQGLTFLSLMVHKRIIRYLRTFQSLLQSKKITEEQNNNSIIMAEILLNDHISIARHVIETRKRLMKAVLQRVYEQNLRFYFNNFCLALSRKNCNLYSKGYRNKGCAFHKLVRILSRLRLFSLTSAITLWRYESSLRVNRLKTLDGVMQKFRSNRLTYGFTRWKEYSKKDFCEKYLRGLEKLRSVRSKNALISKGLGFRRWKSWLHEFSHNEALLICENFSRVNDRLVESFNHVPIHMGISMIEKCLQKILNRNTRQGWHALRKIHEIHTRSQCLARYIVKGLRGIIFKYQDHAFSLLYNFSKYGKLSITSKGSNVNGPLINMDKILKRIKIMHMKNMFLLWKERVFINISSCKQKTNLLSRWNMMPHSSAEQISQIDHIYQMWQRVAFIMDKAIFRFISHIFKELLGKQEHYPLLLNSLSDDIVLHGLNKFNSYVDNYILTSKNNKRLFEDHIDSSEHVFERRINSCPNIITEISTVSKNEKYHEITELRRVKSTPPSDSRSISSRKLDKSHSKYFFNLCVQSRIDRQEFMTDNSNEPKNKKYMQSSSNEAFMDHFNSKIDKQFYSRHQESIQPLDFYNYYDSLNGNIGYLTNEDELLSYSNDFLQNDSMDIRNSRNNYFPFSFTAYNTQPIDQGGEQRFHNIGPQRSLCDEDVKKNKYFRISTNSENVNEYQSLEYDSNSNSMGIPYSNLYLSGLYGDLRSTNLIDSGEHSFHDDKTWKASGSMENTVEECIESSLCYSDKLDEEFDALIECLEDKDLTTNYRLPNNHGFTFHRAHPISNDLIRQRQNEYYAGRSN